MKNIHLLPTENYKQDYTLQSGEVVKVVRLGQLILNKETNELSVNKNPQWAASCDTDVLVPHHIYITSDEEIKEDDWCYHIDGEYDFPVQIKSLSLLRISPDVLIRTSNSSQLAGGKYIKFVESCDISKLKKIILTTDGELIDNGVQDINVKDTSNEFLEWFVKNPSCKFVEWDKNYNQVKISGKKINMFLNF